jgi:hypothetical protein
MSSKARGAPSSEPLHYQRDFLEAARGAGKRVKVLKACQGIDVIH